MASQTLDHPISAPAAARPASHATNPVAMALVLLTVLGVLLAVVSLRPALADACEQDGLVVCGP